MHEQVGVSLVAWWRRTGWRAGVLILCLLPASAQAEHDIGPFRIRDQFLLNMGFLAFDPDSARLLRPGEQQAELIETSTNTFAHSGALNWLLEARPARAPVDLPMLRSLPGNIFYLDGETYRTALSLRRGLTRRLQVGVTAQLLGIEEGHLDRPIEAFHEIFDRDQHGRRGVPRNSYLVYIRSNGIEFYQDEAPGFRFGDVVLQAKVGLIDGDARALSLETTVKLPHGEPSLFSSGATDYGAQLLASSRLGGGWWHATFGVLRLGAHPVLGTPDQTILSGMLAYERPFKSSLSGIVQLTVSESPFRSLDVQELSKAALQGSAGVKYRLGRTTWIAALTENIVNFDNTADVGLHLGVSRNF